MKNPTKCTTLKVDPTKLVNRVMEFQNNRHLYSKDDLFSPLLKTDSMNEKINDYLNEIHKTHVKKKVKICV